MRDPTPYNYPRFSPSSWHPTARGGHFVGEPFIDLVLQDADGTPCRMSELRGKTVVLETGSLSSPAYVRNIRAMGALRERFVDAVFLVLYVREEHPGRRLGPHASLEQKLALARQLYSEEQEHRRVVVDDLAGSAHRALGGLPNMAFVIDESGSVRLALDWCDPAAIERALLGMAQDPVQAEREAMPPLPGPSMLLHVLLRAGADAFFDFLRAVPQLARRRRQASQRFLHEPT